MKKEDLIVGRQVRFTGTAPGGEWPPKNSVLSITKVDGVQIYLDTLSQWFHRGWFTGDEGGCNTQFERYLADYGNWIHENGLEAVIAPAKVDDNSDIANGWFPTSLKNTVIHPDEQNLFTYPYWTNTLRGFDSLVAPYPLKSDQSAFIQTAVSLRKKRISKHKLIKQ